MGTTADLNKYDLLLLFLTLVSMITILNLHSSNTEFEKPQEPDNPSKFSSAVEGSISYMIEKKTYRLTQMVILMKYLRIM